LSFLAIDPSSAPMKRSKQPSRRAKAPRQLPLVIRSHGGVRRGAGRKRKAPRPRVVHRTRPKIDRNHPVHVTIRIREGVPRLRTRAPMRTIIRVLRAARGRFDLRVIQFAVLDDHLHLLVEAEGRDSLTRGMRGLGTRLAIHLNRAFARRGRLFDDRYHARALATPLEVRRGLCYVLQNFRKHAAQVGRTIAAQWIDPCSSGVTFDGWRDAHVRRIDLGTLPPRTWLLAIGWRRHGRIGVDEVPGGVPPPSPGADTWRLAS
jgi:REP element-mobilizing transposase RayT